MNNSPEETLLWKGSPSQWTNFVSYLACLLLAVAVGALYLTIRESWLLAGLILPAFIALTRWLQTRSHVYEITTERVRLTTGLLSRRTDELELYRVRDYTVVEPFWLRLVQRGNLILTTADRTTPEFVVRAVPGVVALKDKIRLHTERMRQLRGVRDLEIDPQ